MNQQMSDAPKPNTRAAAVERMAARWDLAEAAVSIGPGGPYYDTAATLRALLAERDALTDAAWQAGWAAGREAAAREMRAGARHMENKRDPKMTMAVETMDISAIAIRALPVPPPPSRDGEAG